MHLRLFLCGMGHAIRSITRLAITTSNIERSSTADMTVVLSQLAVACPALQCLQVEGDIGRELLAAFGAACPNLSCLNVMYEIPCDTVQQLHMILPNLSEISVAHESDYGVTLEGAHPFFLVLLTCASLTTFDAGARFLTLEMWHALPFGLKELSCALEFEPLSGLRVLSNLKCFDCYCHSISNHVDMLSLVAVLRAAPGLQSLHCIGYSKEGCHKMMSCVTMKPLISLIPDLMYLHHRAVAGLYVKSVIDSGEVLQGLNLCLLGSKSTNPTYTAAIFMASLPPLPACTGLRLSQMEDTSISGHIPTMASLIAAKFPNLGMLTITDSDAVSLRDLSFLQACRALQHLAIERAPISLTQLVRACAYLVSLESIQLHNCGFSVADGVELERMQKVYGLDTIVMVDLPLN